MERFAPPRPRVVVDGVVVVVVVVTVVAVDFLDLRAVDGVEEAGMVAKSSSNSDENREVVTKVALEGDSRGCCCCGGGG